MRLALKFLEGGLEGQTRAAELSEKEPVSVGRDPGSTIALPDEDETASPHHAKFLLEKGEVVVQDSGSHYGLILNGKVVMKARLKGGEQLRFGEQGPLAEVLLGIAAPGGGRKLVLVALAALALALTGAALLLGGRGLTVRRSAADEALDEAKEAYRQTVARTGDFDSVAPDFDEVLRLFAAVPRGTPARVEADGLARTMKEKRAAKLAHSKLVDAAGATAAGEVKRELATPPPAVAATPGAGTGSGSATAASAPPDKKTCRATDERLHQLAKERKKAGKPALGAMTFLSSGEVGFKPGAEPTPEEEALQKTDKLCSGKKDDE